jgi:glycosyltransferase involved in cell wall biosynthesis
MLPFALRQVARQRGVDLEVVLATHGFDADPAVLRSFADACAAPLHTFRADASVSFGEVLNLAARRASGDVLLKMDDDDWYAPDFVLDLLLARGYSGAQVVGCFAEFVFLEPLWTTTRRPKPSEVYTSHVAGGTMLIDRGAFRSLGGFRDTVKYVDANLLSAVIASGGTIYRTHGLGYVLRRGRHGHTWDPGLGYFLTGRRVSRQWRGFRPSRLVEADSGDHPDPPAFSG